MADKMTPDDYESFMSDGREDIDKEQETDELSREQLERLRGQLRAAGLTLDQTDVVMKKVDGIKKGEIREANFVRGHVKRVRVRRELSGAITLITY
jgi:hypothetical protein